MASPYIATSGHYKPHPQNNAESTQQLSTTQMVATMLFMLSAILFVLTCVSGYPLRHIESNNNNTLLPKVSRRWRGRRRWHKKWRDAARDTLFEVKYGEEPPPHGFYSGTSLPSGADAPDVFEAGGKMMGKTPPLTAEEFMIHIQGIEKKIQNDTKLCADERKMWEGVRQQLETSLNSDYCTSFDEYAGACCYIQAVGENYGFCTYKSLIESESAEEVTSNCIFEDQPSPSEECEPEASLEPEERHKCWRGGRFERFQRSREWPQTSPEISMEVENRFVVGDGRWWSSGKRLRTSSRIELYLNLFSTVTCTPTDVTSLCSSFCCTEKYADSAFCDIPCY